MDTAVAVRDAVSPFGIPTAGFGIAGAGTTPPLTPVGSIANTLQATGFIPL